MAPNLSVFRILGATFALLLAPVSARALTINLSALTNTSANSVTIFLTAGTYSVTPIGVADGGLFNAWDANQNDAQPVSWLHEYAISSSEFAPPIFWDGIFYATDLVALSHGISTQFTLNSDGNVNFWIHDSFYPDNAGGVSLTVVPEPAVVALILPALMALLYRRLSHGATGDPRGDPGAAA